MCNLDKFSRKANVVRVFRAIPVREFGNEVQQACPNMLWTLEVTSDNLFTLSNCVSLGVPS